MLSSPLDGRPGGGPVADAVVGDREREPATVDADVDVARSRRWAWRATLDSASRRHSSRWPRVGSSTALSIGPWMSHDGLNPSVVAASSQIGDDVAAQADARRPSLVELEDRRADLADRHVRDRRRRAGSARRRPGRSTVCAAACSDSPVANSRWITSSWRSRAIRSRSSSSPAVRACSCRRAFSIARPGGGGQPDGELLVDVGEHLAVGLVGQVEVAVDDAAEPDRHAEERRHRRVAGREPEAVGMGVEIRAGAAVSGRGSAGRGCRAPRGERRCGPSPRR